MGEKRYKLQVLPLFENDLNGIVDYMAFTLKNPIAAHQLVDDVETAIYNRLPFAESFAPYPSAENHPNPYYSIQVRNFSIFYVVIGDTMEVRRILYSRRDISKLI